MICLLQLFQSQARADDFYPPTDMNKVDVYLITMGLGAGLHERFGHTVIRIVDHGRGSDQNINWGLFDFNDPMFPVKFFRGQLDYMMGFEDYYSMVRRYQYLERATFQQKMNLTTMQKQKLVDKIAWNAQPANRTYRYQYFFNNCATKPRDYIDEALGGKVKQAYEQDMLKLVFRDYVYKNLNNVPFIAFSLDILMNERIDKPLSKWQEMFLPEKLAEYLSVMPAFDDNGNALPNSRLLDEPTTLVKGRAYPSSPIDMYQMVAALFILLLMVAGLLIGPFEPGKHLMIPRVKAGYRVLGLAAFIWGLFAGAYSLLMILSWTTSDHLDLHHNVNLYLYWPLDWVAFAGIGSMLFFKGSAKLLSGFWYAQFRYYLIAHIIITLLFLLVALTTGWDQNIQRVVFTLIPVKLLLTAIILGKGLMLRSSEEVK